MLSQLCNRTEEYIETMASFTATDKGVTRLPFTEESQQAVIYLLRVMSEIGLKTNVDAAANVIGTMPGEKAKDKYIVMGSHYDSVVQGGKYDGVLGIAVALEVLGRLKEEGYRPNHTLMVLGTNDEEGVRFGNGYFGTKALLGLIPPEVMATMVDHEGITIEEAMTSFGYNSHNLDGAALNKEMIKAFLEVHVEQGPVLESLGKEIGIVENIVGIERYVITLEGEANHAGTTPMHLRKDAMVAASRFVTKLHEFVLSSLKHTVATVGEINANPNMINVVAAQVKLGLDIRSQFTQDLKQLRLFIEDLMRQIERDYGVRSHMTCILREAPVGMDQTMTEVIEHVCDSIAIAGHRMNSGAGHDALVMASHAPTAMFFIPSIGGISHHPMECSRESDIEKAVEVALRTIKELDRM